MCGCLAIVLPLSLIAKVIVLEDVMPHIGWGDYIKQRGRVRAERQQRLELNRDRIKKITSHAKSRTILYPEYGSAFDYVHCLYPFAHVRSATVYQVPRAVCEAIGYTGAGGFFDTQSKIVVITDCVETDYPSPMKIMAKMTPDEVLCHELIHYAANYKNPVSSRGVEEEIAYGKSIGYLREKGRSDDDIIDNVMLPYLIGCVNPWNCLYRIAQSRSITMSEIGKMDENEINKRFGTQLNALCRDEARKMGKIMIAHNTMHYDSSQAPTNIKKAESRPKNFVLDDDL